ncbi:MAG: carboxypeptidase regulatory-like domain-containing protein [Deltaproteobacteria bacterium]|nr:carboxypeptidase regulatory-like domain-containing protein [Deltaproteobacteria bacterium]
MNGGAGLVEDSALRMWWYEEEPELRFTTRLYEVLNKADSSVFTPIDFQTMPRDYTGIILPEREDYEKHPYYNRGDYLLTSSWLLEKDVILPDTYCIEGDISGVAEGTEIIVAVNGVDYKFNCEDYKICNLEPDTTYTIVPRAVGYSFTPGSLEITIADTNQTGIDFVGESVLPVGDTISGLVSGDTCEGVEVTITSSSDEMSMTTLDDCAFSFEGLDVGEYIVSASQTGFTFVVSPTEVDVPPGDTGVQITGTTTQQVIVEEQTPTPYSGGSGSSSGGGKSGVQTPTKPEPKPEVKETVDELPAPAEEEDGDEEITVETAPIPVASISLAKKTLKRFRLLPRFAVVDIKGDNISFTNSTRVDFGSTKGVRLLRKKIMDDSTIRCRVLVRPAILSREKEQTVKVTVISGADQAETVLEVQMP